MIDLEREADLTDPDDEDAADFLSGLGPGAPPRCRMSQPNQET